MKTLRYSSVLLLTLMLSAQGTAIFAMNDAPPPPQDEKQAFFVAAVHGDLEIIQKLITLKPAIVNAGDGGNDTALIIAAFYGQSRIVREIITTPSFDPKAHDQAKRAYWIACHLNLKDMVTLLRPFVTHSNEQTWQDLKLPSESRQP